MKLAEALVKRTDLKQKLAQLLERALGNCVIQDGEKPGEDPQSLLRQYDKAAVELTGLVKAINRTNALTEFAEGKMLSDALAERDAFKAKRDAYISAARQSTIQQDRYSQSEIRKVAVLSAKILQKTADDAARDFRELDLKIQAINWQTDLIED
jgi:hypothetical protein